MERLLWVRRVKYVNLREWEFSYKREWFHQHLIIIFFSQARKIKGENTKESRKMAHSAFTLKREKKRRNRKNSYTPTYYIYIYISWYVSLRTFNINLQVWNLVLLWMIFILNPVSKFAQTFVYLSVNLLRQYWTFSFK